MSERIELTRIRTDGGCQPRSTIFLDMVEEYANEMARGAVFPPVVVFYDGSDYWLADGYHRRQAAETLGLLDIESDVRQGTRRDAILFSVGANTAHGMRRTNEDKRRAVTTMLTNSEVSIDTRTGAPWSDRDIARHCNVSNTFVSALRPKLTINVDSERAYTTKHGTIAVMNTSNIGKESTPALLVETPSLNRPLRIDETVKQTVETQPSAAIDLTYSHLCNALMSVVDTIKSLPPPKETSSHFPAVLEHALRAEELNAAARWLNEFAAIWATGQKDRDSRTAAMVRRSKELVGNVTTH